MCGDVTKEQRVAWKSISAAGGLFAEAVRRGSDLQIQNARDPKIASRLPPYFTMAFRKLPAFTFSSSFRTTRRSPAFWSP